MTQQKLDLADIHSAFQQMCGKGVAAGIDILLINRHLGASITNTILFLEKKSRSYADCAVSPLKA